jgi:predicted small secreted protein
VITKPNEEEPMMKFGNKIRILVLTLFSLAAFSITACETVEGAGKDIEKAGEAVQDAAED